LQALYQELEPKGLVVMGFPSNEFGQQEPGAAEKITEFLRKTYGVTFPMFANCIVKPGRRQSPVCAFLTATGEVPTWNFAKYLVGRDGQVKGFFPSRVVPEARALREAIATESGD
jgi:glutathione peroxidase